MFRFTILSVLACAGAADFGRAAIINVDFGDPAQQTNTTGWNNIVSNAAGGSSLANTVDSTGASTGVSMTLSDPFWPGSNQNGPTVPTGTAATVFPAQATRDNLFGSVAAFGGFTEPTGGYLISGLDPSGNTTYKFTFFGSRTGVTDNRETAYMLDGGNSTTVYLNTSNNLSEVAIATGMVPDAGGNIALTVGPGPNNNNASGFYYIGAMQIVSTTVPEPTSLSALALTAGLVRRRR
jgi:hypothetical protein